MDDHASIRTLEVGRRKHPLHQRVRLRVRPRYRRRRYLCPVSRHPRIPSGAWSNSFSGRNFCISVFNETITPTGGITRSALGDGVIRHLYGLGRLLHVHPVASRRSIARQTCSSTRVIRATFLLMPVGSTSQRSPQVSGFDDYGRLTPLRRLYPLPVRQASVLPRASFRFAVTRDTLASG